MRKIIKLYICLVTVLGTMTGYAQDLENGGNNNGGYGGNSGGTQLNEVVIINNYRNPITPPPTPPMYVPPFVTNPLLTNPTPPIGGGASGGGGTPPKPKPPTDPKPDPCAQAKSADARANNVSVAGQNDFIRTMTNNTKKEYGNEQKLNSFPPSDTPVYRAYPIRTDNASGSFQPNFSWNAKDGYMVGATHGHPGNGAPSPADLVYAYKHLNNPELVAAGQTAIDYYKNNFSVTTLTTDEIYVVKVNDWDALKTAYETYNANSAASTAANDKWGDEVNKYSDKNTSSSYAEATAYAGLILYGNAVTILKKSKGDTNFTPLVIDSSKKVTKKPCPNEK